MAEIGQPKWIADKLGGSVISMLAKWAWDSHPQWASIVALFGGGMIVAYIQRFLALFTPITFGDWVMLASLITLSGLTLIFAARWLYLKRISPQGIPTPEDKPVTRDAYAASGGHAQAAATIHNHNHGNPPQIGPVVREGTYWYQDGTPSHHVYRETPLTVAPTTYRKEPEHSCPVLVLVYSETPKRPTAYVDGVQWNYGNESELVVKNCSDHDAFVPYFRIQIGRYRIFSSPHQQIQARSEVRMVYGVADPSRHASYTVQYFGHLKLLLDAVFKATPECRDEDAYLESEVWVYYTDASANKYGSKMTLRYFPEMVGMPIIRPEQMAVRLPEFPADPPDPQPHGSTTHEN